MKVEFEIEGLKEEILNYSLRYVEYSVKEYPHQIFVTISPKTEFLKLVLGETHIAIPVSECEGRYETDLYQLTEALDKIRKEAIKIQEKTEKILRAIIKTVEELKTQKTVEE